MNKSLFIVLSLVFICFRKIPFRLNVSLAINLFDCCLTGYASYESVADKKYKVFRCLSAFKLFDGCLIALRKKSISEPKTTVSSIDQLRTYIDGIVAEIEV